MPVPLTLANALDLAGRFAEYHCPDAMIVLLAGSAARETATAASDIDVVALYDGLPGGARREMVAFEGRDVEVFVHDLGTLRYFCDEIDRPSAQPSLPTMVVEGREILCKSPALLSECRRICRETLEAGPPPPGETGLANRRYAITDLALSLSVPRSRAEVLAIGCALYSMLAHFCLRAAEVWDADGKALSAAIAMLDQGLAGRFTSAFTALISMGEDTEVQALVDEVLKPYGGRLRVGYQQTAPTEWRK